ncbi:MAG: hypothetical protein WC710_09820 [Gallionella sp.]|jgi:hypothetical protein
MKHTRLFTLIVLSSVALYAAVGFYFLPLATFTGPLTRMGMMPESLFGWTKEQPTVKAELLVNASWQEADVLAIGDSFSMPHLWQSVLVERGIKVHTETWESMRNICEDFSGWLDQKGFRGRHVVIEVVEHNFEDRLSRSLHCKKMDYHPMTELPVTPPLQQLPDTTANLSGKLSIGIQTRLNILTYQKLIARTDFSTWNMSNTVRMNRVSNGCELFSHAQCRDVLFFADDHVTDFSEQTLNDMKTINQRMSKVHPVWVVVPDKSTAYLHPDKQFWNKAENDLHAPNVLQVLRKAISNKTIDLYPANETHLSTAGYLILGNVIHQSLQP